MMTVHSSPSMYHHWQSVQSGIGATLIQFSGSKLSRPNIRPLANTILHHTITSYSDR